MTAKSKLNEARKIFHSRQIKKTGHNKFSNYNYFELSDFLVPALEIFYDLKLSAFVSFETDIATMEITDLDDESSVILIKSPMSTAELKACHAVQNLGAVETYIRRYLWVTALEIVEHDAIDSGPGPDESKSAKKGHQKGNERAATAATRVADEIIEAIRADLELRVVEKYQAACNDPDEDFVNQVWARLNKQEREYVTRVLDKAAK